MYDEWIISRDDGTGLMLASEHDPALYHVHSYRRLLAVHDRHAQQAFSLDGVRGLRVLDPVLLKRIADTRTFRVAVDQSLRRRGKAPGPNGLRLEDLQSPEIWSLCRALAHGVLENKYMPGNSRAKRIPKFGKPGQYRTLTIQNVEDRVVARAVVLVLRPITELIASPFSFGFRTRRNRMHALASALALASAQKRWQWVKVDVENAFDRVPFSRLMAACSHHFPNDVMTLIRLVTDTGKRRGLRQGSPLSPMLFNLYADQTLTQPWQRHRPSDVLIRYADDILMPFSNTADACEGHEVLARLATSAGIRLKPAEDHQVCNIASGQSLTWLGYLLRRESNKIAIRISDRAWQQLDVQLAKAHLAPESPVRRVQVIQGWIEQMGPCQPYENAKAVLSRIRAAAAQQAFDELPSNRSLQGVWAMAYHRWRALYRKEAKCLSSRLAQIESSRPRLSSACHSEGQQAPYDMPIGLDIRKIIPKNHPQLGPK